jgi:hypothetical protein
LHILDHENDNSVIIREEFVGFRHAGSVKGAAICDIIVRYPADPGLDINKIRAKCYDGAANMAGKYSDVQARILQLNPEASYGHCKAHSLNLALIHSSKDVCVRNMMPTVQEIAFSFDYSAKWLLAFSEELSENQTVQERRCSATTNAMMKSNVKIAPIYCAALSSCSSFKTSNEDTTTGNAFRKVNKESALLDHLVSQRVRKYVRLSSCS